MKKKVDSTFVSRLSQALEYLADINLKINELQVIGFIYANENVFQENLRGALKIQAGSLYALCNKLISRGYIRKNSNPIVNDDGSYDRRRVVYNVTETGEDILIHMDSILNTGYPADEKVWDEDVDAIYLNDIDEPETPFESPNLDNVPDFSHAGVDGGDTMDDTE